MRKDPAQPYAAQDEKSPVQPYAVQDSANIQFCATVECL